jgi:hypothetical protein
VSVIKDDGSVVSDSTLVYNAIVTNITFQPNTSNIFFMAGTNHQLWGDVTALPFNNYEVSNNVGAIPSYWTKWASNDQSVHTAENRIRAHSYGVTFFKDYNENSPTTSSALSSVAYLTSTYNSGYMTGDIKGAWLSDTDTTNAVGTNLMSGAAFNTASRVTSYSYVAGSSTVVIDDDEASGDGYVNLTLNGLAASTSYVVSWSTDFTYPNSVIYKNHIGNIVAGTVYTDTPSVGTLNGNITFTTAGSGSPTLVLYSGYSGGNLTYTLDLRLADSDRSVNGNGLQVNGTITKTAVATGADLVAYSGFSASNYLEQPYNADLDFGTGDFSIMWWQKGTDSSSVLFERLGADQEGLFGSPTDTSGRLYVWMNTTIGFTVGNTSYSTGVSGTNIWSSYSLVGRANTAFFYVDGVLKGSFAYTGSIGDVDHIFRIGRGIAHNTVPYGGSLALFRISATAPTAAQILEIYNAEKPLFQENAKCTLNGTSDAVQCLAYDDSTSELVVGTSSSLSVFKGLRRVDEELGNFTEVSQQGGMRITEKA